MQGILQDIKKTKQKQKRTPLNWTCFTYKNNKILLRKNLSKLEVKDAAFKATLPQGWPHLCSSVCASPFLNTFTSPQGQESQGGWGRISLSSLLYFGKSQHLPWHFPPEMKREQVLSSNWWFETNKITDELKTKPNKTKQQQKITRIKSSFQVDPKSGICSQLKNYFGIEQYVLIPKRWLCFGFRPLT